MIRLGLALSPRFDRIEIKRFEVNAGTFPKHHEPACN
jgi:hypothetical protein